MSQDWVEGIVEDIYPRSTNNGEFWNIKLNGQDFGWGKFPPKFGVGSDIGFEIQWNGNYANVNWDSVQVNNQVGNGPAQGGGSGRSQGGGQRQGGNGGGGYQRSNGGGGQRPQGGGGYQRGAGRSGQPGNGGQQGGYQRQGGGQQQQARPQQQQQRAPQGGAGGKDDYWARKEERDVEVQKAIQYQASRNAAIATLDILLKAEAVKLPAKQADKYDAALALLDTLTERFNEQTTNLGQAPSPSLGGQQYGGDEGGYNQNETDDDGLPPYNPD